MTPKQVTAFALGPFAAAVLGLITVPILTWFFTAEDIGRLSMLQITISFSILLFGLGLDQAYVREYYETENKPRLLHLVLLPGVIIIVFVSLFSLYQDDLIGESLFGIGGLYFSLLVVFSVLISFISRFLSLYLRLVERGLAFSISQVLPKVVLLFLLLFIFLLGSDFDFKNLILIQVISLFVTFVILLFNSRNEWINAIRQSVNVRDIQAMVKYSLPLAMGGIAYWGLVSIDKIFIKNYSSFEELGFYSVAVNFAAVAIIFQGVFGLIWSPWIYKLQASGGVSVGFLQSAMRKTVLFSTVIFCGMGLTSWLITFIIPDRYSDIVYIVLSCMGVPLFYIMSEVSGIGVGITKKTNMYLMATLLSFIICVVLNYFMVPLLGATGAAVSTCFSLWFFYFLKSEASCFVWNKISRIDMYFFPTLCMIISNMLALKIFSYSFSLVIWFLMLVFSIMYFRLDVLEVFSYLKNIYRHKKA